MRKIIILFYLALCTGLTVYGQKTGIRFETGSLEQALAKAKYANKYVFIDCYTVWCGPCKQMAGEVFTDPQVASHFNSTFINYKLDMEKGEGRNIAKRYGVSAYPTFLFLDGNGKLAYKAVGAKKPEAFLAIAREVFNEQNVLKLGMVYKQHLRDSAFMYHYFSMLKDARMTDELRIAVNDYLNAMTPAEYLQPGKWKLIRNYVTDYHSPIVKYLLKHPTHFFQTFGKNEVTEFIANLYWARYRQLSAAEQTGTGQIDRFIEEVKAVRMTFIPPMLSRLYLLKYYYSQDLPRLAKTLDDLFTYGFLVCDVSEDIELQAMVIMEMELYCKALTQDNRKEYNPQIIEWFKVLSTINPALEYRTACISSLYGIIRQSGDQLLTTQIGIQKDSMMKEYYQQNPPTRESLEATKGMMDKNQYEHLLQEIKRLGVEIID